MSTALDEVDETLIREIQLRFFQTMKRLIRISTIIKVAYTTPNIETIGNVLYNLLFFTFFGWLV